MNRHYLKINDSHLFHNFSHFRSLHTLGTYLYFSSLKALQTWLRRERIRQGLRVSLSRTPHRPEFIEGFSQSLNIISKMKCKEKDKTHIRRGIKCAFYPGE
jgi:hypothetical protein